MKSNVSKPKTLFVGAVIGALGMISNGASADCDSEVETCKGSCQNSYAELTTACAEACSSKYDECGNLWAQLLMTREERDTCRALAYADSQVCIRDAERFRDQCRSACDENWEACNSY